jgi:hypothetical protein
MKAKITQALFICTLALGLSAARPAFGDDCSKKLDSDRARIDRDAAKHGEHSPEVDKDVARMDNDRQWCRDHHSDWDHSKFDVGIYIKH